MSDDAQQHTSEPEQAPNPAAQEPSPAMKRSLIRYSLVMPLFFMVMFPLCYITALHQPSLHDFPVAVVGQHGAAEAFIDEISPKLGDKFDLVTASGAAEARHMMAEQAVKAAYIPAAHPGGQATLLLAGAFGRIATQLVPAYFSPVAQAHGVDMVTKDIAPLAPGDASGIGLMFFMLIAMLVGYMSANILGSAAYFLRIRARLGICAGIAVVTPTVVWSMMGPWLDIIVGSPWQIITCIALAAVALFVAAMMTTAATVFLGKWALFPCMLLFVFLNIPSSNSTYPAEAVPSFFSFVSEFHLGAGIVNAMRAVLYFDGTGFADYLPVILSWTVLGVALVLGAVAYRRRSSRKAAQPATGAETVPASQTVPDQRQAPVSDEHTADERTPDELTLAGEVHGPSGTPLSHATVTVLDSRGHQVTRSPVAGDGRFHLGSLPCGAHTIILGAQGHHPVAHRRLFHDDTTDLGTVHLHPA